MSMTTPQRCFRVGGGLVLAVILGLLLAPASAAPKLHVLERVTTAVPYPRGLVMHEGTLYVLARGRVRGAGGVSAAVEDQAGTLFAVAPKVSEPTSGPVGEAVRHNGRVLARPSAPPFILWDRTAHPPQSDRLTDRPYCTLRFHEPTRSFYLCAFSGIDMPKVAGDPVGFSKNRTDALLRYDLRTGQWYVVERHRAEADWRYPHHDPAVHVPPHGLLEGPDNCLPLGRWLYAVAKDNSVLARYDLSALESDPEASPPPGEVVLGARVEVEGVGEQVYEGHSGLAYHDGWLYVAYRTSSVIVRLRLNEDMTLRQPVRAQLLARFDPFDPVAHRSADLTDLEVDAQGRVYVVSAQPARIYRFTPDPANVFDARGDQGDKAWADLAALTGNPRMKSENALYHDGWLYVTSGDGYDYQQGAHGTVYRVRVEQ